MATVRPELRKKALQMHKTLLSAVDKAGGSGRFCTWENLERMTVTDLMDILGINRIRFVYRKPRGKKYEGA